MTLLYREFNKLKDDRILDYTNGLLSRCFCRAFGLFFDVKENEHAGGCHKPFRIAWNCHCGIV